MLSSVLAKNQSYLSVRVVWRLTDHGVFTSALVSLSLRLLDSKNWSHVTSGNFQEHGLHKFDHLQPGSVYLLNVSLHNKHKEIESKALVFWSAATNCTGERFHCGVTSEKTPRTVIFVDFFREFYKQTLCACIYKPYLRLLRRP